MRQVTVRTRVDLIAIIDIIIVSQPQHIFAFLVALDCSFKKADKLNILNKTMRVGLFHDQIKQAVTRIHDY
jgi:hypothetical protein